MTEISQGWRDSEEVRAARHAIARAWDNDLQGNIDFATVNPSELLDVLCSAVWASAVRGRAKKPAKCPACDGAGDIDTSRMLAGEVLEFLPCYCGGEGMAKSARSPSSPPTNE